MDQPLGSTRSTVDSGVRGVDAYDVPSSRIHARVAAKMIPCSRRDRITVYCVQASTVVFLILIAIAIVTGRA